jgi:hypothetical protein
MLCAVASSCSRRRKLLPSSSSKWGSVAVNAKPSCAGSAMPTWLRANAMTKGGWQHGTCLSLERFPRNAGPRSVDRAGKVRRSSPGRVNRRGDRAADARHGRDRGIGEQAGSWTGSPLGKGNHDLPSWRFSIWSRGASCSGQIPRSAPRRTLGLKPDSGRLSIDSIDEIDFAYPVPAVSYEMRIPGRGSEGKALDSPPLGCYER